MKHKQQHTWRKRSRDNIVRKKINIFISNRKLADYIWANNEVSVRKLGTGSENIEKIFRDFPGSPVVKTLHFPLQRAWVQLLAVELGFPLLLKKIKKGFYTSFWLSNWSVSDPYWKQLASPRRWGILDRPGLTRRDCISGTRWQGVSSPWVPQSPAVSSTLFVGVILTRPEGQQVAFPDAKWFSW